MRTWSSSHPIHTGTLWGEPSLMRVARCAKFGRSSKDFTSLESSIPMCTSFLWGPSLRADRSSAVAAPQQMHSHPGSKRFGDEQSVSRDDECLAPRAGRLRMHVICTLDQEVMIEAEKQGREHCCG